MKRILTLGLVVLLTGCANTPDAVNPVAWYKGMVGYISDEEAQPQSEEYPSLSQMPERPQPSSSEHERQEAVSSLEADHVAAVQTDKNIREGVFLEGEDFPDTDVPPAPATVNEVKAQIQPLSLQQPEIEDPSVQDTYQLFLDASAATVSTKPVGMTPEVPSSACHPGEGQDPSCDTVTVSSMDSSLQTSPSIGDGGSNSSAESVAKIYFANGSAELTANDQKILRQVATIQQQRGGTLKIQGHASARTRTMDVVEQRLANFEMSSQRANAVAKALQNYGVDSSDIVVEAKADGSPIYAETMPTGEAGNRRVEIYLER